MMRRRHFTTALLFVILIVIFRLTNSISIYNISHSGELFRQGSDGCDIFHGEWVRSSAPPKYTDVSCPYISKHQNCLLNGRNNTDFQQWRWQPHECELPPFDSVAFLQSMRGKTVAFVGDSVSRNHMESLLCLLTQVEKPTIKGNRTILRYHFPRSGFNLVRLWAAWLVEEEIPEYSNSFPKGFKVLHLDRVHSALSQSLENFDVLVISSAHWWIKPTAYFLNNKLVGFKSWPKQNVSFEEMNVLLSADSERPDRKFSLHEPLDKIEAYRIAIETVFNEILKGYRGLTIFRTVSPNHYIGGQWDSGGTCSQFTAPSNGSSFPRGHFVSTIYSIQMETYHRLILKRKSESSSKFVLEDVTPSFLQRPDGHPGRYRNKEAIAQIGLRLGKIPEDCLHWCTPGPIDVWNDMLFELLNREL